jgi:hypothetical protein
MAASTPKSSNSSTQNADFTRPQEPQSPTNLNRTTKRHQRALNINAPPRLDLGSDARTSNTATTAIGGRLDAIEREAKLQRTVMYDFASTVDKFVSSYKQPEQRSFAHDMCNKIVSFLTTSLDADTNGSTFVPIRVRSQPPGGTPSSSATKSASFADMAKTLKNSGADFRVAKATGRAPTSIPGGVSPASATTNSTNGKKREDRRLLIPVEPTALLQRPEPFALRQELCTKITGLTLASIPLIAPTRTGWAITPSDLTTRDLLLTKENTEIILRVLHGTAVKQPEIWHNYAVPGVPVTVHQLVSSAVTNTAGLIEEEVVAQTKERPISCRPSRHGANPLTGKITWIVSFLIPVRPFRLFNASELSKSIDKKSAITRHDPGCQSFCNPAKCTRYARCSVCSTRIDQHIGPSGANCTEKARCANCHGPFPAGHDFCPAAPRRKNGKTIKPTKKELDILRRHGDREFRDAHANAPHTPTDNILRSPQPQSQTQGLEVNVAAERLKRKRGSVISACENAGSQHKAPSSQASSQASSQSPSLPPSSQPSSSRPRRSTVSGKNLNLANLSAQSLEVNEEGMEIDNPNSSC